jgi:hypothetical protein
MSQIFGTTGIYCQYALEFCRLNISSVAHSTTG